MFSTSTIDVDRVIEFARVVAADPPPDRAEVTAGIDLIRRVNSWLHARQLAWTRALESCSPFPEQDVATARRTGLGRANRLAEQARVLESMPQFEALLERGETTTDHAATMASVLAHEDPTIRSQLYEHAEQLSDLAATTTAEQFRHQLAKKVRQLQTDNGVSRLARQKRATSLRAWTDNTTGMWHVHGQFDPESAFAIRPMLDAALERMHGAEPPPTCPKDPRAKQDHLRALALVALLTGEGPSAAADESRQGAVDIAVVLDLTKPVAEIDWGIDIDLPPSFLADLIAKRDVTISGILVSDGVVVSAPGVLDQGRGNRLANRAQRRALRAMYRCCAVPGCDVAFGTCKIHHIIWWTNDGLTDLSNLIPLCIRHHATVHAKDWLLRLTADRVLTITDNTGRPISGPEGPNRTGSAS